MGNPNFEFIEQKYFSKARRMLSKEAGGYFKVRKLTKIEDDLYLVKWENYCDSFWQEAVIFINREKEEVKVQKTLLLVQTEEHHKIHKEFIALEEDYKKRRTELEERQKVEMEKAKNDLLERTIKRVKER